MSTIKNLDRLLAKLDAAGTQAAPIMEKGVKKGTKLIQGSAKDLCPEDTGALRNSIRTRTEIKENIVTGDVYTNKAYADMEAWARMYCKNYADKYYHMLYIML